MSPVAVDSPLRRSEVFKTPRTVVANDDDAERRSRRFEASLDQSVAGQNIQIEENETIKMCLQLYSDNKLNKDNAWNLSIIDTFSKLMSKHSKGLENFQAAGSTLEASAKVYGLRVDSVHTDVMRMCSELTRQSARAMDNNRDDGDLEDAAEYQENVDPNTTVPASQPVAEADRNKKKKRKRQIVSTVTKNRDTINQKLDTNAMTDPFFAKLNSVVGDVNSSNRLMQNIVPTSHSELRLRMNYRLWDDTEIEDVAIQESFEPANSEITSLNSQNLLPNLQLHNLLYGYVISDTPAEEDEEAADDTRRDSTMPHDLDNVTEVALNRSALDVQFDVNAEVDPIQPIGDAHIMEFHHGDDPDDFNEEDHFALNQCRGLRRSTNMIEDLRPVDVSLLEYSYRPLDMISQYWAGPSHWKFKRAKATTSMSLRFSAVGPDGSQISGPSTGVPQKQTQRGKKKKKSFEAGSLDESISPNEDLFVGFSMSKPLKSITYLKSTLCKKWDAKKLRLPTDLKLDRHRFDVYQFAQGMKVHESDSQTEPDIPVGDYNYNNPADQEYCARPSKDNCDEGDYADNIFNAQDGPDFHDDGVDIANGTGIPGDLMPPNQTVDFISSNFEGAPDKVAKILIPYARTAKVVDMKQMKSCCWRLIENKNTKSPENAVNPTFKYIYAELPHVLTKPMSENISLSLAFYSVLHLANEKSLKLCGQADLEDFAIITEDRQ